MTDNYDLDSHEHEAHEGEEGHQPQAEAWPDDQPPADDFTDPGAEETATSSEETSAQHEEEMMDSEPRKSSALLPIIAGIGGLLFLGAVLYWQFGRSSSTPSPMPSPPPLQMAQIPVSKPAPAPAVEAGTKPASKDPTIDLAAVMKQPMSAPADVAPKTSFTATENPAVALPTPSTPSAPSPSSVAPPLPSSSSIPTILPPPSTAGNVSLETRVNELSAQMGELKKELDKATQQLGQMNASLSSPSFGNASVEDRLAKIEDQMKRMESPSKASTSSSVLSDSAPQPEAIAESKPLIVSRHKTKAIKVAHKASSHSVKPVAIHWVLRAATPTDAWVAKDDSTSELHHVRVGEELPGVGHINAIHQNGDSWVIEGSAGTIR